MAKTFLDRAYGHARGKEAVAFYDEWADVYDKELTDGQYITPMRCAEALAQFAPDQTSPILDLGCGTGLSGKALAKAGFTAIDGWDPSSQMLQRAQNRHAYRVLRQIDPEEPLSAPQGAYAAVNAAGVLSPGLAPPEAFDQILTFLRPAGLISFSLNDHALEEGSHARRVEELAAAGAVEILFQEHGDHIPATGLKATVYVIRKLAAG